VARGSRRGRHQECGLHGTLKGAENAGRKIEAKGYRALLMPAQESDAKGWRKEWKMGLKNPAGDIQDRFSKQLTDHLWPRHTGRPEQGASTAGIA